MKLLKGLGRKQNTLIRYFLSYFLILTVFFFAFFFLLRSQLTNIYSKDLHEQTEQKIEYLKEQISGNITSISQIHNSLTSNINIILSHYSNEKWQWNQAARRINEYAVSNHFIDTIVYYDQEKDTIISSGKYVKYQDGSFYIYMNSSSVHFSLDEYSNTVSNSLLHLSDRENSCLVFLPFKYTPDNRFVFYIVNTLEVENILKSILSDSVLSVALVNAEMEPVTGLRSGLLAPYLKNFDIQDGIYPIDRELSVCIISGLPSSYSLVALMSNHVISDQVNAAFQQAYFIFVLLWILGLFLILVGMNLTYRPLYRLTKKIVDNPSRSSDYLEQLDNAFSFAVTEKQALQEKIEKYRLSMQKSILSSIVQDNGSSIPDDLQNIDQFFTMEPGNDIFAIKMQSKGVSFPIKNILQFFHESLPAGDSCILLESSGKTAVFLLNYSGPEQEKDDVIRLLMTALYEESGYYSAISNHSSSPLEIPSLYGNAVLASNYWNNAPVIAYSEIASAVSSNTDFSYPYNNLAELSACLQNLDFSGGQVVLNKLFDWIDSSIIQKNPLPNFFIRCILIDVLTAVITAMNQAGVKFKSYNELYFETLYYCRSCSYQEENQNIRCNLYRLLDIFKTEVANTTASPAEIQRIIEENFASPDFSITLLADNFGVSVAYMSYLVKKEFKRNFSDYIWDLRMSKATELMRITNMSIEEIGTAVGYSNISSFRRKFKQETGQTPSQYRADIEKQRSSHPRDK